MPTTQLYYTLQGLINGCSAMGSILRWICLYQNEVDLVKGFDPTLLEEADFSGYARIELDSSDWSNPATIDSNLNATISHPELTWAKSGATANAEIWGFYFLDTDGATILFAQEFAAAPYPMVADGDLIRLTPRYSTSNPVFP